MNNLIHIIIILLGTGLIGNSQIEVIQPNDVIVGDSKTSEPSAKMEVNLLNNLDSGYIPKGMLMPRMSFDQMNAIADPRDAVMVFVNDTSVDLRGYYYYDGKFEEWIRIPSNNCRGCSDLFFGDTNNNGIPDKIITSYECGVNCGDTGNDNIISISANFNDLCDEDLQYNTYEVFIGGNSVTGILELDSSGEICYESENINGSSVSILLYSDCCCATVEYISFPNCAVCPDCSIDLAVNCINDEVELSASPSCTLQELLDGGYTTVNVYTHPSSTDFNDAILETSAAIIDDFTYSFTNTSNIFSLWVTYAGSDDCEEIIIFEPVECIDNNCFCLVTNVSWNNPICIGETGVLEAQLNCDEGWTSLQWNWDGGSTTTNFPDDDIVFGSGLSLGAYDVTVTPMGVGDCTDIAHVEVVVIDECEEPCLPCTVSLTTTDCEVQWSLQGEGCVNRPWFVTYNDGNGSNQSGLPNNGTNGSVPNNAPYSLSSSFIPCDEYGNGNYEIIVPPNNGCSSEFDNGEVSCCENLCNETPCNEQQIIVMADGVPRLSTLVTSEGIICDIFVDLRCSNPISTANTDMNNASIASLLDSLISCLGESCDTVDLEIFWEPLYTNGCEIAITFVNSPFTIQEANWIPSGTTYSLNTSNCN